MHVICEYAWLTLRTVVPKACANCKVAATPLTISILDRTRRRLCGKGTQEMKRAGRIGNPDFLSSFDETRLNPLR
jgi:hypothetical protein